jgi:hypothetical protein
LVLVVFVLVALAIFSSPLFLLGPAFRQLIFVTLRLTLEKQIFLLAFLVITFNVLNDILQFFHLLHLWFLLEAWVAEVTGGHVDAASNVQVIRCHSFHAVLMLLSSLLGDAVLAVRICVVGHKMLLHKLLVCHLLWFFFLRQLLLLLVDTWELISHCHAIIAIDVTFVTFHTMWVYELRRFLELLLLGKFRLEFLLAFD